MSDCDESTFDVKWTRNRLPSDLVNAQSLWLQGEEFDEPKTLHAMGLRLLKFVHFGEGYLDGSNFTHGGARKRQLHDLFCSALPVVRQYVRKLCLHGQHLFQNETTNVSKFLASIPHLTEIEFCGIDRGMPHNLAFPLEGLGKNTSGKLRKITFNCVDVINGVETQSFEALAAMTSIKELEVRCCSRWIERNIRRAFFGHQRLESIMMDCYLANEGLAQFLASLPNLRSFRSINAVYLLNSLPDAVESLTKLSLCLQHTPLDVFTTSLDLVLRRAQNLKELELTSYSMNPERNDADFGLVLSELSVLESLKIMGSVRWEYLLRCQQLKSLSISTVSILPQGWLEALLTRQGALKSLELLQMDCSIINDLFRSLEENVNLKSLTVRFKNRDPTEAVSEAVAHQMRKTLLSNKTLTSLSLSLKAGMLSVVMDLVESDNCCLKHLRLDDVSAQEDSSLWVGLLENSTLSGLALYYRAHRQERICEQTWNTILNFIRQNKQVKYLELEPPGGSSTASAVDDLAIALDKNTRLTDIKLRHDPRSQPQFDFVCRLFGRRNRFLMTQTSPHLKIPKSLWPLVLQSMPLSSLFLITCQVPLPTPNGKRKRNSTMWLDG